MIEKIKPRHDPVFGVETLYDLSRYFSNVPDERVVGRFRDLVGIYRPLQRIPIGPQRTLGLGVCRLGLLFFRETLLIVEKHETRAGHVGAFPIASVLVIGQFHAFMGCINDFW